MGRYEGLALHASAKERRAAVLLDPVHVGAPARRKHRVHRGSHVPELKALFDEERAEYQRRCEQVTPEEIAKLAGNADPGKACRA